MVSVSTGLALGGFTQAEEERAKRDLELRRIKGAERGLDIEERGQEQGFRVDFEKIKVDREKLLAANQGRKIKATAERLKEQKIASKTAVKNAITEARRVAGNPAKVKFWEETAKLAASNLEVFEGGASDAADLRQLIQGEFGGFAATSKQIAEQAAKTEGAAVVTKAEAIAGPTSPAQREQLAKVDITAPESPLLEAGTLKTVTSNSIRAETASLLGGTIDPRTGQIVGLDPTQTSVALSINTLASTSILEGKHFSVAEAVQAAAEQLGFKIPTGLPPGVTPDDVKRQARAAITAGKDPKEIADRIEAMGLSVVDILGTDPREE